MTKKLSPFAIAILITILVAIGGVMTAISNSQDTRSGARGRPTELPIPAVGEEKMNEGLAKMEQVVREVERYNDISERGRGRPSGDIAALAKELKKDQENLEYLLAAVGVSGVDTSSYRPEFEEILIRAREALNEAMYRADDIEAQDQLIEALNQVETGLSNINR